MTCKINPLSVRQRILSLLSDGPATTGEVAFELGRTVKNTHAHLNNLALLDRVTKTRFPQPGKRVKYLWGRKV